MTEKFGNLIIFRGFKVNESDKCNQYKYENSLCTIICLYVDGMLNFESNLHVINDVNSILSAIVMKDLGEANVILHIKITRSEKKISLNQSHYIKS